jgi:cytochrome b6-f complex iron-sulfur subunit
MKRRYFLKKVKSILGIGAIAPLVDACSSPEVNPKPAANFTVDLTSSNYAALKVIGGVVNVQGVFIERTGPSTYIGLSQVCTHAGCSVGFNSSSKQFVCPCHGGVYDSNGKVVSGPPPSALAQYQVTLSGTTLTISG